MPFSMAFQPIVDVHTGGIYAYEALVRGPHGEGAGTVLSQVTPDNRYAFDQSCRRHAITLASRLHLQDTGAKLSINFLPGAVYSPAACIQLTLSTARQVHFPLDRLIFELTEREEMDTPEHLQAIADEYEKYGFQIALDDFGAGYANLNVLASLHASVLKLDMELTRNLAQRPRAQQVVRSMVDLCGLLGVTVIGEGVETVDEYWCMRDCGISLMQGYLFAKPAFEALPPVEMPATPRPTKTTKPPARTLFPTVRSASPARAEAEPELLEA
jgi:EAL domain-containing protein (putative c-di-GMP-specific phosphodiesterase class I)